MEEGTPNVDYYMILEIPKNATDEEIKKAYRKLALKFHPDKATGAEAAEKYAIIRTAYETLIDPKLRQVYDKYGVKGIEMIQKMGAYAPFINPSMLMMINTIMFVLSLMAALLIVFPSLLAARIDKTIEIPYSVVFIPLFIVDAVILIFLFGSGILNSNSETDEGEPKPVEEQRKDYIIKGALIIYILLFLLFQVLICAKLEGAIISEWGYMFIPWFLMEGMLLVLAVIQFVVQLSEPVFEGHPEAGTEPRKLTLDEKAIAFHETFTFLLIRIAQGILITIKISGGWKANWAVVFIPTWILAFTQIAGHFFEIILTRQSKDILPDRYKVAIGKTIAFLIMAVLGYSFIGMLLARLQSSSNAPKIAVVFIPLFIILGMIFCCFCCCIPLMVAAVRIQIEQDILGEEETQLNIVVSDERRIQ